MYYCLPSLLPVFSRESLLIFYLHLAKYSMKAVVFKGPGKVVIEDRPIPKIQDDGDIIVKVDKVNKIYTILIFCLHKGLHY